MVEFTTEGVSEPRDPDLLLRVRGLTVRLPDGACLLDSLDFDVRKGEVVVIVGGSGAGKSTLLRAVFDPQELVAAGLHVEVRQQERHAGVGLVPQRGALFDHLDVAGNVALALRNAQPPRAGGVAEIATFLKRVDLPESMALRGTKVSRLSGGQAQRLAVARTLAAGRPLVFYDEPSTGLDPYRVRLLASEILDQARAPDSAAVVVTHDIVLAAAVGSRVLMLDPHTRQLRALLPDTWPGPQSREPVHAASVWESELEAALIDHLARAPATPSGSPSSMPGAPRRARRWLRNLAAPFGVAGLSLVETARSLPRHGRDFAQVLGHVLRQALWRPLPFYAIVSALLGFTLLYVVSRVVPAGVRPGRAIELVGASYIVALTPPLAAFLYVATSASAVNAWLGGMGLTHQVQALEALGIARGRYLWAPSWCALAMSFLISAVVLAAGLFAGGVLLCMVDGVTGGPALLLTDLFDPAPDRMPYVVRALWLVVLYAFGIASDAVARGGAPKATSDAVTASMTRSVVASTFWVVALELISVFVLFAVRPPGGGA